MATDDQVPAEPKFAEPKLLEAALSEVHRRDRSYEAVDLQTLADQVCAHLGDLSVALFDVGSAGEDLLHRCALSVKRIADALD